MKIYSWLRLSLFVTAVASLTSGAEAALVMGSTSVTSRADQMIRLLPGTPLNPTANPIEVPTSASGNFSLTWENQGAGDTFANLSSFTATYTSQPTDPLGQYTIVAPAGGGSAGTLTNIIENSGQLVSATLTADTTFQVTLADGTVLFTKHDTSGPPEDQRARFVGTLTANTPAGTVFASTGDVNLYTIVGGTEVLVAQSFGRTVTATAVPEPTSGTVLLLTLTGICFARRRRA